MDQVAKDPSRIHEDLGSVPGLAQWHCRELWCRSQMLLGSHVAVTVVQAGSCSSFLTGNLHMPWVWP